MNPKNALLGAGMVALVALAANPPCCQFAGPPTANASPLVQERVTTVQLAVQGMTCGGCALAVRSAVKKLDGVKKADVSYKRHSAVITYDSAKVELAQIIAAIGQAGFKATVRG